MHKNHIRRTIALLSFVITLVIAFPALGATLFGPKQYVRTSGAPNTYTDTFQSMGGTGSLIIRNGNGTDTDTDRVKGTAVNDTVTSAKVYINGTLILVPSDFKKDLYSMEKSVQLNNGTNTLYVELSSSPGSYITAEVTGSVIPSSITLDITSPSDGTTLFRPDVNVQGTISNTSGAETGVIVNGVIASVFGDHFAANHVPLTEGQNTITVTATDTKGTKTTKAITVNSTTAANYIKLSAYPESGISPLEVTLRINGSFSISNPAITFTGPSEIEQLTSANADEYKYKLTTEGVYYFTAQATGPDNNTYQDTMVITILSLTQVDTLLRDKWAIFTTALGSKDTTSALNVMSAKSKERYQTMFHLLNDQLPAIVATQTGLVLRSITDNKASYDLETTESEGQFVYRVVFIKDENGLWCIRDF